MCKAQKKTFEITKVRSSKCVKLSLISHCQKFEDLGTNVTDVLNLFSIVQTGDFLNIFWVFFSQSQLEITNTKYGSFSFVLSIKEAEKKAKQLYDTVIWDDNGDMHWSNVKPAFFRHPKTGEDIWFNQVTIHHHTYYNSLPMFKSIELPPHKYPCTVYYGDGSTIEPEVIQHLRAVSWSCAVGFRWRKGDLLVLDNLTVQHGRIGFTGKREILVHLMTD